MKSMNKIKPEENIKYFYMLIILFLILWGPSLFLDLGFVFAGLWGALSFLMAHFIVETLRKRENK